MQLYIIRHAQSTNNALPDERGRVCDPPLTSLGWRQAETLARHLATRADLEPPRTSTPQPIGHRITRLYCSAMLRALQTAQPIAAALNLTPVVWPDIHECGGVYLDHPDGGTVGYPGLGRSAILGDFPGYELPDTLVEEGWYSGGFEEWEARQIRAERVAAELIRQRESDDTVAMISHGDFIKTLLRVLFRQPLDIAIAYYHYNTAITRLDLRADGYLDVHYLNRVEHLPPDLIS